MTLGAGDGRQWVIEPPHSPACLSPGGHCGNSNYTHRVTFLLPGFTSSQALGSCAQIIMCIYALVTGRTFPGNPR